MTCYWTKCAVNILKIWTTLKSPVIICLVQWKLRDDWTKRPLTCMTGKPCESQSYSIHLVQFIYKQHMFPMRNFQTSQWRVNPHYLVSWNNPLALKKSKFFSKLETYLDKSNNMSQIQQRKICSEKYNMCLQCTTYNSCCNLK